MEITVLVIIFISENSEVYKVVDEPFCGTTLPFKKNILKIGAHS